MQPKFHLEQENLHNNYLLRELSAYSSALLEIEAFGFEVPMEIMRAGSVGRWLMLAGAGRRLSTLTCVVDY